MYKSSLFPLIVPVDAAVAAGTGWGWLWSEGLSHVAFVVRVAAFIVEGAAGAEGMYFFAAAGEQMALMLQHDDALLGFHILLFHCSLWIYCFFFLCLRSLGV